jgi:hypothetical protein
MRIFVLTATYKLRISRKSHLRDHPNGCHTGHVKKTYMQEFCSKRGNKYRLRVTDEEQVWKYQRKQVERKGLTLKKKMLEWNADRI